MHSVCFHDYPVSLLSGVPVRISNIYDKYSQFIAILLGNIESFSYLCSEIAKSQYIGIMTQQEIGSTIKERRKKLGVNQQTLADLAGVAVNTLVAIERGEGNPQLSTLLTILDTLGLQVDINIKQLEYERM